MKESDYVEIIWTTFAEFPGLILAILLIDRIGRRKTLATMALIAGPTKTRAAPWAAAIGMSLSSVAVVLNAMRLSRGTEPGAGGGWSLQRPAEAA
mgnify:CR=1 FL=1